MQIGLLGKANVGKSTFFSAATQIPAASGNFPFTTIEPNVGVAYAEAVCACKHFGLVTHDHDLCKGGIRLVPFKLIDIAGLVPGAHEGKGLGNKFLDDARQAEALIHVIDAAGATDIQGQPVPIGTHDPVEDVRFVRQEFDLWFAGILKKDWSKITREAEQKKTRIVDSISSRFTGLGVKRSDVQHVLQQTNLISKPIGDWNDSDIEKFAGDLRAESKPMVIAANKADLCESQDVFEKIADASRYDSSNNDNRDTATTTTTIPCSAEAELLLRKAAKIGIIKYDLYSSSSGGFVITKGIQIPPPQKKALDLVGLVLSKIHTTGVQKILNTAVFELLGLIVAYPVEDETRLTNKDGEVLPDARLMPAGSTVRDLAETIHADIAKGLLHAIDCKTKQRVSVDQKLKNGDVIKMVSTLSRG